MPANPAEVATITALGSIYNQWEFCEFERRVGQVTAHLRVRVMEVTPPQTTSVWSNLRLRPGDRPVTVTLAGRAVMTDGIVTLRQGAMSGTSHQIEIVASSKTTSLPVATTLSAPQYKNATFMQIANSLTAPLGISVYLRGDAPGADQPFQRVSIHPGETILQAIERLASFRNLHLVDDASGNLVCGRGDNDGSSIAELVEGQNIESAHAVMSIDDTLGDIWAHGQSIGTDGQNSDQARDIAAIAKSTGLTLYRPGVLIAEMPTDQSGLLMRTDFASAISLGTTVECFVTVPGWLMPDGSLWAEHLWQSLTVYSPMLFPRDGITLSVRGVKHRQSNEEGTTSIIELCLPQALSSGFPTGSGEFPPGNSPATPAAPDD